MLDWKITTDQFPSWQLWLLTIIRHLSPNRAVTLKSIAWVQYKWPRHNRHELVVFVVWNPLSGERVRTEQKIAFSESLLPRSSLSLSSGSVEIADFVSIPCLALPDTGRKTRTGFCMRQDRFSHDVADTKDISCGLSCVSVAFDGEMPRSTVADWLAHYYSKCTVSAIISFAKSGNWSVF